MRTTAGPSSAALAEVEIGAGGQVVTKGATNPAVGRALDAATAAGQDVFIELY